jgi:hypothetical protein
MQPKVPARVIWAREERIKKRQAEIDAAKTVNPAYDGPAKAITEDLKREWEHMQLVANIKFPAHLAAKFDIRPNERVAAIARTFGWTLEKVANACGVGSQAVASWFRKPAVIEYVRALEYHLNARDTKELIKSEQYSTIQCLVNIRDDPTVAPGVRADIAKWMYEQEHGKAKEHREISGVNVRDLTEQLMRMKPTTKTPTDEREQPDGPLPKHGSS